MLLNDRLVVNLHQTIPLLIREAKSLAKLDIELPIVAATLMVKQSHFHTIQDSLNVSKPSSIDMNRISLKFVNALGVLNYIHNQQNNAKNVHFNTLYQHFQDLIKMFLATVKQVKLEVRPLFLPQLVQLTSMLKPGLYSICVSFVLQNVRAPAIFYCCFCCDVLNKI